MILRWRLSFGLVIVRQSSVACRFVGAIVSGRTVGSFDSEVVPWLLLQRGCLGGRGNDVDDGGSGRAACVASIDNRPCCDSCWRMSFFW